MEKWWNHLPIAHRGLHNGQDLPENSLAAFSKAIEMGYPIELDVHLLKDGQWVVFHDINTERLTGESKNIGECHFQDICHLTLFKTKEKIPLLMDVLNLVSGRVPIYLEVKAPNQARINADRIWEEIKEYYYNYPKKLAILSFNHLVLKELRLLNEELPLGMLTGVFKGEGMPWYKRFVIQYLSLIPVIKPQFIAEDINSIHRPLIQLFRKKGYPVIGWTVRNNEERHRAASYCDNFIFENICI